ncbi:hypothetical protein BDP55DRAFT_431704 [Colletotrichum godetiae]|uniref:Secreted protein n=1 Tax=Colletotrichum godetiae TaxID=1209918 RepID=A0AAJ0AUP2_9PEZI|nr:uncharacterized protein BDP55DRAFT_431704 [Colletotrichum godetiae]KAK1689180.1 hypothetical protein BDP55DRAFT_431704 [Colletotrichum godetiae]
MPLDVWLVVRILTLTVATGRVRVLPCRLLESGAEELARAIETVAEWVDLQQKVWTRPSRALSYIGHPARSTRRVSPRRHTISNARGTLVCMIRLTFNCKVCVCQPSPAFVIASHISNRCSISAWTSHLLKIMP